MTAVVITDRGASTNSPDNTDVIQQAINGLTTSDQLVVPAGTFLIRNVQPGYQTHSELRYGLKLKSNMQLILQQGAELKAILADYEDTNMLWLEGCRTTDIIGPGKITGDRVGHTTPGEHGHCVRITSGCDTINLNGFVAQQAFGDGICVDNETNVGLGDAPRSLTISKVLSTDNRRQGLSVVSVNALSVTQTVFSNIGQQFGTSSGTDPGCGIDLECDTAAQQIKTVRINGNVFSNLRGSNIGVGSPNGQYSDIIIGPNSYYPKTQPIWTSGAAGKISIGWVPQLMHALFGGYSGYPTTWSKP